MFLGQMRRQRRGEKEEQKEEGVIGVAAQVATSLGGHVFPARVAQVYLLGQVAQKRAFHK